MKPAIQLLILLVFTLILGACTGAKYLEDGEKLLYNQSIVGVEKADKDELTEQITLTPNIRIPILGPIGAAIYESAENHYDTAKIEEKRRNYIEKIDKKIAERDSEGKSIAGLQTRKSRKLERFQNQLRNGNFGMRTGTPLAVYDERAIDNSKLRMENYLMNHGFRKAEVAVETKEKGRKVNQKFIIHEGPQSFLDSLNLRTGDPKLTRLVESSKSESFLEKGEPYNKDNIDLERQRIESLLRDRGYFDFNKRFIEFEAFYAPDTTNIWLSTIINKPADKPYHQVYYMDSIIFNAQGSEAAKDTINYRGVTYHLGDFDYSEKVLDTRLIFREKDLYNYTNIVNTQRQLLAIDIFRYVNINFDTTLVPGKLITNIYTAPLKKFQLTQELGMNVTDSYPGPFYNVSLKNRNVFGGLEILEFNAFVGSEGISGASNNEKTYQSYNYGGSLGLNFPRFVTPFPSRKLNLDTFNPKTTISLGYSYIKRPEYKRETTNGTFSYNWQNLGGNRSYNFNLADINLIYTRDIDPNFEKLLDQLYAQGNTLRLAFKPSFVSSTSFSSTLNSNYSTSTEPSSYFRYFTEAGGNLYNFVGTGLLRNNGLEYYQFLKLQTDYRRYYPLGKDEALVFRANVGVAKSYSGNKTLPYEKYFFTGGSSSNRAWKPRRLGPGSSYPYLLDENGNNVRDENGDLVPARTNYQFEQPGEILLELNAEYRSNLVGFLDWAFFVDAGNIWRMFKTNNSLDGSTVLVSPGANFELNRFYKEIAVGAGLGLRFDFSFLVFRLDMGHKIRDPRFPIGQRWLKPFSGLRYQNTWNIAVGYPF